MNLITESNDPRFKELSEIWGPSVRSECKAERDTAITVAWLMESTRAALAAKEKAEAALCNEKRAITEISKALENCRHDRDNKEAELCKVRKALKACAVHASSNPNNFGPLAQRTFPPSEGYWRMMAARVENEANKALSSTAPCQHEAEAKRLRELATLWYLADGTHVTLTEEEVIEKRKAAAKKLATLDRLSAIVARVEDVEGLSARFEVDGLAISAWLIKGEG